jgi:hypothetical protein
MYNMYGRIAIQIGALYHTDPLDFVEECIGEDGYLTYGAVGLVGRDIPVDGGHSGDTGAQRGDHGHVESCHLVADLAEDGHISKIVFPRDTFGRDNIYTCCQRCTIMSSSHRLVLLLS